VAALKALLLSALVPHGKEASISQLLRRHSYVVSLKALVDGQLSVAWYTVGSRKTRSVLAGL
jgi:hypothetical protein